MLATIAFAFLAGVVSALSPCVLPILPIVLAGAASQGRYGPLALSIGVAVSFTAVGLFLAVIGFAIGLDTDIFRDASAVLLVGVGIVLLVPVLQVRFAVLASPLEAWAHTRFGKVSSDGWLGQLGVGSLLGAAWSPCVGPTLGAASLAAARSENLPAVAATMATFGIGAAFPLLLLGLLSREVLLRWRSRLRNVSGVGKMLLGGGLVIAGLLIVTGLDRKLETTLVDVSPPWLTELTTRF